MLNFRWLSFPQSKLPSYEQYLSTTTNTYGLGCTSWYGHKFEETKNGTSLFCPTCGEVKKI